MAAGDFRGQPPMCCPALTSVPVPERGSSAYRLGVLREAISQLVKRAKQQGVTVIAVEKLNFADLRTRHTREDAHRWVVDQFAG